VSERAKINILYVDDEGPALEAMKIGLEDRGYAVTTSLSGDDALKLLKANKPDVIIADLRMQPMNGFELYQKVKKVPGLSAIPFFFLTAVDDFLAKKYGKSLGVDAYITKPVDVDSIDSMIKRKLSVD
jgi:response regulator RpfG family c-di-GMP phosphodiesterase